MIYLYDIEVRYEAHTDRDFAENVLSLGDPVAILTEEEWAQYENLARKIDGELFLGKTEDEKKDEKSSEIRLMRDELLRNTDWTLLRAMEMGKPVPTEWSDYRQALRDVTEQEGFPFEVTFPDEPTL